MFCKAVETETAKQNNELLVYNKFVLHYISGFDSSTMASDLHRQNESLRARDARHFPLL